MLFMGKLTISMAIFNSYVKLPEAISMEYQWDIGYQLDNMGYQWDLNGVSTGTGSVAKQGYETTPEISVDAKVSRLQIFRSHVEATQRGQLQAESIVHRQF